MQNMGALEDYKLQMLSMSVTQNLTDVRNVTKLKYFLRDNYYIVKQM